MSISTTNRKWQNHIRAKGIIPFFLDRLQQHALANAWQHGKGSFSFEIKDREADDELTRMYFEMVEEFPYEFYVELTNKCNLDCTMCARPSMTRPTGIMKMPLFRKIIDEIAENQPYAFIHYYGIGESMVDKAIFTKLAYAVSKGLRNGLLFTNGQLLLTNDNYRKLAEVGISNIGVDLDGFRPETYEAIRVGGSFTKAKEGIERLYQYIRANNLRTRVEIAYQIVPSVNEGDLPSFVAWCNDNGYEYKLVPMHNWGGLRDDVGQSKMAGLGNLHHTKRETPCSYLWGNTTIAWDGRMALCFFDADLRDSVGDVTKKSIKEIWQGQHQKKRIAHVQGRFEGICAGCNCGTNIRLPEFNSRLYPEHLRNKALVKDPSKVIGTETYPNES